MSDPMRLKVDNALMFLRAGGQITWREWIELQPDARAAFVVAGDLHHERQAAKIARFVASPAEAIEVLDGGEARRRAALEVAVREAREELREARVVAEILPEVP